MEKYVCPNCGAPISANDAVCKFCGSQFSLETEETYEDETQVDVQPVSMVNAENWPIRSKKIAAVLAIILGSIGVHYFYLGNIKAGIVFLILSFIGLSPFMILVGVIQGIYYFLCPDEKFMQNHKVRIS